MQADGDRSVRAEEVSDNRWTMWAVVLAFTVISAAVAVLASRRGAPVVVAVAGLFAIVGAVQLLLLARNLFSLRKFGDVPLLLDEPPRLGGHLKATLRLPPEAGIVRGFHAHLTHFSVSYGEKDAELEQPRWARRKEFHAGPGNSVTVLFDLPADQLEGNDPGPRGAVRGPVYGKWELKLGADLPWLDFSRTYKIKVLPVLPAAPQAAPLISAAAISAANAAAAKVTVHSPVPGAATSNVVAPATHSSSLAQPQAESQQEATHSSVWVLVAANLVPLVGVAFWGWKVHEVVFLYWVENLVIGAFNVLRILVSRPEATAEQLQDGIVPTDGQLLAGKVFLAGFFTLHYGAFCYGHGIFLAAFFPSGGPSEPFEILQAMRRDPPMLLALSAIIVSHGYSFIHNYLGRGEYRRADFGQLMSRPYKRIFVTHLFILGGGFLIIALHAGVLAILVFVALKIGFDVWMHRQERTFLKPVTS